LEALQSDEERACLWHVCQTQKLQGLCSKRPLVLSLVSILPQLIQQLAQLALMLMMQRHILGKERLRTGNPKAIKSKAKLVL